MAAVEDGGVFHEVTNYDWRGAYMRCGIYVVLPALIRDVGLVEPRDCVRHDVPVGCMQCLMGRRP